MKLTTLVTLSNEEVHSMIMSKLKTDPKQHKIVGLIPVFQTSGCWELEIKIDERSSPLAFELEN